MAKRLFKLFGFHIHDAPGEAEAECALLQQQGIVDAVLSEDVDTIMFGCTVTIRNWSSEATRAACAPTHVSVYDVADLKQGETGLDREGLVLVALMSGGDYIPEGVPGCGIKLACEAAKAGFGRRLCRIKRSDTSAVNEWRQDLRRELLTNESKYFRRKHKAVVIPDEFPNMEVLRYYTHPVVSDAAIIEKVRREIPLERDIDLAGLRAFTGETFDWTYKSGAIRFIKILAPSVLNQILFRMSLRVIGSDDPGVREAVEGELVQGIRSRRTHFNTDGTPELRISYIPKNIVRIDLDAEEEEVVATFGRSGLALNSDDEEAEQDGEDSARKNVYDPFQPDLVWVPEAVAKLGVPLTIEDWEGAQRAKQLAKEKKTPAVRRSRKKAAADMPTGALDIWVKTSQPTSSAPPKEMEPPPSSLLSSSQPLLLPASPLPKRSRPQRKRTASTQDTTALDDADQNRGIRPSQIQSRRNVGGSRTKTSAPQLSLDVNPWSIASSQATPKNASRIQIYDETFAGSQPPEAILISSSPECSPVRTRTTARRAVRNSPSHEPLSALSPPLSSPMLQDPFENFSVSHSAPIAATSSLLVSPQEDDRLSEQTSQKQPKATASLRSRDVASSESSSMTKDRTSTTTAKPIATSRTSISTSTTTTRTSAQKRTRKGAKVVVAQQQASIKSFGRNAETTAKLRTANATAKPVNDFANDPREEEICLIESSDNDDEEFQDVHHGGGGGAGHHLSSIKNTNKQPPPRTKSNNGATDKMRAISIGNSEATATARKSLNPSSHNARKRLSSFSLPAEEDNLSFTTSPRTVRKNKMTRLYCFRSGSSGFFEEMQVTLAEADHIMARELESAKRPDGGGAVEKRMMWRESEVTVLDLTGE